MRFIFLVKEIQVKWKNIRDSYTRTKKQEKKDLQEGVRGRRKKKYIFYNRLTFLDPIIKERYFFKFYFRASAIRNNFF